MNDIIAKDSEVVERRLATKPCTRKAREPKEKNLEELLSCTRETSDGDVGGERLDERGWRTGVKER